MNTISKILYNCTGHPVPQSYQSISPPDFMALCPSKLYAVRFAAASFNSHEDGRVRQPLLIIIPFCIIVEIDGSEISLYTA